MNTEFVRGMCLGALAGAAAEVLMLTADSPSVKKRARHTIHAVGDAVDDVVDNISHTLR